MPKPAWLSGRAAKGIARALGRRGARMVTAPESFFVNKDTRLVAGETDRARRWGAQLTDKSRALEVSTIRNGDTR